MTEEAARLWPEATRLNPNYAAYKRITDRKIPLVILEPISSA